MSAAPPSVLARILQSTREELGRRKQALPLEQLRGRFTEARADPRDFSAALARPGISVIAEFKRRSPSAGALREHADLADLVRAYERGGASALSVLTEEANFAGSLDDLSTARGLCALPALRKDFIVDEYQLLEARMAGADAVLLIVAALSDPELSTLQDEAQALGLDVLVEVHDRDELDRALAVGAELIGVNNRDLRDFSVDLQRTMKLRGAIPDGVVVVSESGIGSSEQLRELEREGVDAVLVGESLMRAAEPEQALRELLGERVAGRSRSA
ncbi:MAG: indole-3-glycerol phosphate synthase TrpC [Solirubrobacterales bacterium]